MHLYGQAFIKSKLFESSELFDQSELSEPASLKKSTKLNLYRYKRKLTWLTYIVCYYPDHLVRYLHIWISKFRSSVKSCKFPISTCCRLSCIICWSRCVRQSLRIPTEPLIPLLPLTCSSGSRSFSFFFLNAFLVQSFVVLGQSRLTAGKTWTRSSDKNKVLGCRHCEK